MPDINDGKRAAAAAVRAQTLINEAEATIKNKWVGRSWSDVIGSSYAAGRDWATSSSVLKASINFATGGLVDKVAGMTGLDKLGETWTNEALKQVWALLEDDIKGAAQETAEDWTTTKWSGQGIMSVIQWARGVTPFSNFDEQLKASDDIKMRFAELNLRASTVQKVVTKGGFRYCDDVHAAMAELAHAEACREDVVQMTTDLIATLKQIRTQAQATLPNSSNLKAQILVAARNVVGDTATIQHKMHANFGVLGGIWNARTAMSTISSSCSKEKCFGPKP
jgi:hypothetical protein